MKKTTLFVLCLFVLACQKKPPSRVITEIPPEEPVQKLAWDGAKRARSGFDLLRPPAASIQLKEIANQATLPKSAVDYFRNAFQNHLQSLGIKLSENSEFVLSGALFKRNGGLVFGFTIFRLNEPLFSDSANVPDDARLQNTLAQFETPPESPEMRKEVEITSPLAELPEPPLDVHPTCTATGCALALLFGDRLEVIDPETHKTKLIRFSSDFFSSIRSRAPSGKIVPFPGDSLRERFGITGIGPSKTYFIVTHNNLATPLYFDSDWNGPFKFQCKGCPIPVAEPGVNSFSLADGHFFDFELDPPNTLAVITTTKLLNVASAGKLASSSEPIGGTLCLAWPNIYTSSPSLKGERDAVMKFVYKNDSITLESVRSVDGEILDLAVTDLNNDSHAELLITMKTVRGISIEVFELF